MKPTIVLQPIHNSSSDILRCFAIGKPLNSDQMNFLAWHEYELSSNTLDPIIQYYITYLKKRKNKCYNNFLLPHEEMNLENIKKLKERIQLFIKEKYRQIAIPLSQKQYLQFREANKELIWYDTQFALHTHFFPSTTPPVLFFQWGKLLGVVKFVLIAGQKASMMNVVVYFEDMEHRDLKQCVAEYQHELNNEIALQKKISGNENVTEEPSLIKTPRLTLTNYYLVDPVEHS